MLEKFGELGIHLPSLLIYLVNFGLLLALLYIFGYKPILRMLDQRSATIKDGLDQAEKARLQAARAEEEIRDQLQEARRQGQAIVAQAAQMGEKVKEEARAEARQEAQALLQRGRGEIETERGEMVAQLRREFADLAIRAAEKVINRSLDKKAHRELIEEVLKETSSSGGK
jgi:F-type H+-transporting ATPase subunit b